MENTPKPDEKTWVEEIQVQGGELVGKVQELLRDARPDGLPSASPTAKNWSRCR